MWEYGQVVRDDLQSKLIKVFHGPGLSRVIRLTESQIKPIQQIVSHKGMYQNNWLFGALDCQHGVSHPSYHENWTIESLAKRLCPHAEVQTSILILHLLQW